MCVGGGGGRGGGGGGETPMFARLYVLKLVILKPSYVFLDNISIMFAVLYSVSN